MEELKLGLAFEKSLVVEDRHSAGHLGSGSVAVYATPMMILHMEEAALSAVDHLLGPGRATVGVHLDVRHLAATPVGMRVRVRAELIGIDGRTLSFKVEAWDEADKIGEGSHLRAVIDTARFAAKIEAKKAAAEAKKG